MKEYANRNINLQSGGDGSLIKHKTYPNLKEGSINIFKDEVNVNDLKFSSAEEVELNEWFQKAEEFL